MFNYLTSIVFFPNKLNKVSNEVFLHGDFELNESSVNIYITETCSHCERCIGLYSTRKGWAKDAYLIAENWIHIEKNGDEYLLKELKIDGELKNCNGDNVVVCYDQRVFAESRNLSIEGNNKTGKRSQFQTLIQKLRCSRRTSGSTNWFFVRFQTVFKHIILFLSALSKTALPVTKYSSIAVHIDNYLNGFIWVTDSTKKNERETIQKMNFIFSVLADLIFGAVFVNWLTSQFSCDSFPKFFMLAIETIVHSLRNIIHWLTGDPAGFKLNYTFSKILATFFLYYIDIWCVFLALLKPAYRIIFQIFLNLGRIGITVQVSIISDLLVIVSFHIYSICIFAARLYNIQISALLALWRLFLGRKKNPLRGRVDSCKYSPEQLFIGTLGFTILLFLLPTTLIYYFVFTFMRILLITFGGVLRRIQYFVHSLPIYSTVLWLIRSPKVVAGIELIPQKLSGKTNCMVFQVKPVCTSWWETICYYKPDFVKKPEDFNFLNFMYLILTGALK